MGNMMTFLSNRFTWLVELKKSLPRQRRLLRILLLNHFQLALALAMLMSFKRKKKISRRKLAFSLKKGFIFGRGDGIVLGRELRSGQILLGPLPSVQ